MDYWMITLISFEKTSFAIRVCFVYRTLLSHRQLLH